MITEQMPPTGNRGRQFYAIQTNCDGTVDVYLFPEAEHEYDMYAAITVVTGVIPWDGLEEDIRRRYDAWCKSGDIIIPRKERTPMKPETNFDEIVDPTDKEGADEELEKIEYEAEDADDLEVETIFILEDGEPVEMEVPDDAEDDQA